MFVTGCHRSGTSLVSALFKRLVLDSSDRQELVPALENPFGFFESRVLVETNDNLLSLIDSDWLHLPVLPTPWDSPNLIPELQSLRSRLSHLSLSRNWVDKDPRLCLTFPAFLHILLRRVPLIAVLRDPISVATSLYARNGLHPNAGLAFWFLNNYHLSTSLLSSDLLLIHDSLHSLTQTGNYHTVLSFINAYFESNHYPSTDNDLFQNAFIDIYQPSFCRAGFQLPTSVEASLDSQLYTACLSSYQHATIGVTEFKEAFLALPSAVLQALQRYHLSSSIVPLRPLPSAEPPELTILKKQLSECDLERKQLEQRLINIENSRIWRSTSLLRRFKDSFSHH